MKTATETKKPGIASRIIGAITGAAGRGDSARRWYLDDEPQVAVEVRRLAEANGKLDALQAQQHTLDKKLDQKSTLGLETLEAAARASLAGQADDGADYKAELQKINSQIAVARKAIEFQEEALRRVRIEVLGAICADAESVAVYAGLVKDLAAESNLFKAKAQAVRDVRNRLLAGAGGVTLTGVFASDLGCRCLDMYGGPLGPEQEADFAGLAYFQELVREAGIR